MEKTAEQQKTGMRGFTIIWIGQIVSLLGTGMTRFAFVIWAFEETGSATTLSLVAFFQFAPVVLASPVAGALVDRWNRKLVIMFSDIGAGLATGFLLLMYLTGNLEIWHLYLAGALAGLFESFQFPAFSAAMTTMLDKKDYARANGMLSTAGSASQILAPVLGGLLLTATGLGTILLIDIVTVLVAVALIAINHIPQPEKSTEGDQAQPSLWRESLFGFQFIWARPSLFGMQMMFLMANFLGGFGLVLLAPAVLTRTGNNEWMLGIVQSSMAVGGLVGGILMSVWGGPGENKKVHGVLLSFVGSALLGNIIFGIGQSLPLWIAGAFLWMFFIPIMNGSNQALWQAKVPADLQGRVFATRRLLAQITGPLAMLLAGPLADRIFEPALQNEGSMLFQLFSPIVGSGPGAGIGAIFVLSGLIMVVASFLGYLFPAVRDFETILPDAN